MSKYNDEQLLAIESEEPNVVVIAPAGSGKTTSLVGAIRHYVKQNPMATISAITFTRKATAELSSKLFDCTRVDCATIHSWSRTKLMNLGAKYKFKVKILTDEEIQDILLDICRSLGYYSMNYMLLTAFVMGGKNLDITDATKAKYNAVLTAYTQLKRNSRLYDFTDLPLYLYDVLVEYDEFIHLDALFVDEFQDVDTTQADIFDRVITKKKFFIGDPWQSIYQFRGACSTIMDTLLEKGFKEYTLTLNYRSTQSIIDFATAVRNESCNILDVANSEIKTSWIKAGRSDLVPSFGEVVVVRNAEAEDLSGTPFGYTDAEEVVRSFLDRRSYILCRSNKQVKAIGAMGYANASTVHMAKGLEYDNVIVVDFGLGGGGDSEELNIAYVACTRARNSMLVIDYYTLMDVFERIMMENPLYFKPKVERGF